MRTLLFDDLRLNADLVVLSACETALGVEMGGEGLIYQHLKAGQPKDVALRRAQLEMMSTGSATHPFHWAAFTLSADWRDGVRR